MTMTMPFPCAFRPYNETDTGLVVHSWLESYHDGAPWLRKARFGRYKGPMRRAIHRVLTRSTVVVACDPEDQTHVLGWVAAELVGRIAVMHYAYVRQARREKGLARELARRALEQLGAERWGEYTCDTFVGVQVANRRGVDFAPFALWETPAVERATSLATGIDAIAAALVAKTGERIP